MTEVTLTQEAERDLIDIYLYGAEIFGPRQADRYAEDMADRLRTIANNPSFGADYSDVSPNLRRAEHVSHAIYYRPTPAGIHVLRVLHGRMDPGRHL